MSIRLANQEDIPQILAIYAPYITDTTFSFEYTVPDRETFTRRFLAIASAFPWLVWEENGEILGYAYGSLPFERAAYAWCCEASVYLRQDVRRRGIGKQLYCALEHLMMLQGYKSVYAIITSENKDSLLFHEAMGYKTVATFPNCGYKKGTWLGTVWMEKPLANLSHPAAMPLPFPEIMTRFENLSNIFDQSPLSQVKKI